MNAERTVCDRCGFEVALENDDCPLCPDAGEATGDA